MKKAKRILATLLSAAMVLSMAACGSSPQQGGSNQSAGGAGVQSDAQTGGKPDKVYEIKLSTTNPSTDPSVIIMYEMCEKIKERTNGGVDIQVYANGELGGNDESIEAVIGDAAFIYFGDISNYSDYVPEASTLCAAYLYDDYRTAELFQQTDVYQDVEGLFSAQNLHIISNSWVVGNRGVMTDGIAVKTVEDCKRLNIRVPTVTMFVDAWTAFGANFTAESWSAGFSDCQSGLLSGAEGTPGKMVSSDLGAVLKKPVYSCINYMTVVVAMACGQGFWDTLPAEYQNIITEEMANYAQINNVKIAELEEEQLTTLENNGVQVIRSEDIDLDSFKNAVAQVNASYPMWEEISGAVNEIISSK